MATTAQAIERIAKETGILHANVFRTARALREHDTQLWPQGSQGKGQAAHVEASHLVNLVLALAMAETTTSAPEVATRLRAMVNNPTQTMMQHLDLEGGASGLIVTKMSRNKLTDVLARAPITLGYMLECFVQQMALHPHVREQFQRESLEVQLADWPYEYATIKRHDGNSSLSDDFNGLGLLAEIQQQGAPAAMRRTVTLPFALFEVLADLYADTLSRKQASLPIPVSEPATSSAGPEMENAGPLPERPALIRDQDRDLSDLAPLDGQREANGEREQSQAPSLGPGRSHPRQRKPRDGRAANPPDATAA